MSKLFDQIEEVTKFLLSKPEPDIESLYRDLVEDRARRPACFEARRIDMKTLRVTIEPIAEKSFRNIVLFMERIGLVDTVPVQIQRSHSQTLRSYSTSYFRALLHALLDEFLDDHETNVDAIRGVIEKIEYPDLRNVTTIHESLAALQKKKRRKTPGLQDLNRTLTLYSDLDVLERKSPTLFF